jgi:hypothetical protein
VADEINDDRNNFDDDNAEAEAAEAEDDNDAEVEVDEAEVDNNEIDNNIIVGNEIINADDNNVVNNSESDDEEAEIDVANDGNDQPEHLEVGKDMDRRYGERKVADESPGPQAKRLWAPACYPGAYGHDPAQYEARTQRIAKTNSLEVAS